MQRCRKIYTPLGVVLQSQLLFAMALSFIDVSEKITTLLNSWSTSETHKVLKPGTEYTNPVTKVVAKTSSHSTPILNFKAAFFVGVEISVDMNTRERIIVTKPQPINRALQDGTQPLQHLPLVKFK